MAAVAVCQSVWIGNVLSQVIGDCLGPMILYIDNKSAIVLAKNSVFHGRIKHIDIGEIIIKHVFSDNQHGHSNIGVSDIKV